MKRNFNNSKYLAAHGREPRGRGNWWFKCGGIAYAAPTNLTLTEAKKAVMRDINRRFFQ